MCFERTAVAQSFLLFQIRFPLFNFSLDDMAKPVVEHLKVRSSELTIRHLVHATKGDVAIHGSNKRIGAWGTYDIVAL